MNVFDIFISRPLGYIMWACFLLVKNYGVALILFTIFTKLILFPLAIKQQKSSAKMAVFQPKLAALQKQYANNKAKLQEETTKLHAEEGYNPLSGCLPMLIQLPILFGLINVVYNPITHILQMPKDLVDKALVIAKTVKGIVITPTSPQIGIIEAVRKTPEVFEKLGTDFATKIQTVDLNFLGINLGEKPVFDWKWSVLIPLLSGLTSLIVSYVSMKKGPQASTQQAGTMKTMMYIMPLFSAWFTLSVPAGVGLYWIISNIVAIAQVYVLNFFYNPDKLREEFEQASLEKRKKVKDKVKNQTPIQIESENVVEIEQEVDNMPKSAKNKLAEARKRMEEKYGSE
jgi:YidC/Oxa1 family membrane protein insertase